MTQPQILTEFGEIFCVVFPYTLKSVTPNFELIRFCISKILEGDIHRFSQQMFDNCSWIPLTMVKPLPLNSALLYIRTPALAFNCSYASSRINETLNSLTFAEYTTSYICVLRNPQQKRCADKITLQVYVCGIH